MAFYKDKTPSSAFISAVPTEEAPAAVADPVAELTEKVEELKVEDKEEVAEAEKEEKPAEAEKEE